MIRYKIKIHPHSRGGYAGRRIWNGNRQGGRIVAVNLRQVNYNYLDLVLRFRRYTQYPETGILTSQKNF